MQMYQGLPTITNKIPPTERGGIPHHLLDIVGYDEPPWYVGVFARESIKITKGIHDRGKVPILVGGTHYYTKALLFRDSLVSDATEQDGMQVSKSEDRWPILLASTEEMLAKLTEVDPVMARHWHPNNRRKIRRSLEIWFQTGRPASEIYAEQQTEKNVSLQGSNVEGEEHISELSGLRYPTLILWLKAEKDGLNTRLDARVNKMIDDGLEHESAVLYNFLQNRKEAGIEDDLSRGIWVSIGYKELLDYVAMSHRGDASPERLEKLKSEAIERVKIATKRYAKNQDRFIRFRLMGDIVRSGILGNIFVLDCSTVSALEANVILPAASVTEKFLQRKDLPDPREFSVLARDTLSFVEKQALQGSPATISQRFACEVCEKVLLTPRAWKNHLASRKHRQTEAAQKKARARKQELNSQNSHGPNSAITLENFIE